jgi:rare lipoprotein A
MARPHLFIALTALASFVLSFSPASAMGPKRYHDGETQRGLASWYGFEQQGHLTADGETFDMHQLTAAHRQLPFGTIVRVTNRANGLSVEVRINDRGPFDDDDRIIDVSEAAADILQMKTAGIVGVEIEVIHLGSPGRPSAG